jgi:cation diffusion facilitator CzcD-associated flavoprotein CzcO/acetyl esterase/lipase
MSWQARWFSSLLRQTFKRRLAAAADAQAARRVLNSALPFRTPDDVVITPATLGGVPGEWVEARAGSGSATLLYLHGGGYFACSAKSHRPITTFFAQQGLRVFAPDYRLAPEHPFPAAIDDAQAVYAALLADGIQPVRLAVAGDSAGGGLTLALLLRLREHGVAMPAAAALFSPLTDLAATGASMQGNTRRCAMFVGTRIAEGMQYYLSDADPRDPFASPLYADLRGLPPLLIHVGADETLLDDSTRLAARAEAAGVPVSLRIWPEVPHVWQLFRRFIPEGRESLAAAAAFIKQAACFGAPPGGNAPHSLQQTAQQPDYEVAVVGAGFSGLGMAIRLKETGIHSFVVLEKANDIGGTWRDNTYPGCACDVPSHMYSFSRQRKPDWSRMYSSQPEILAYLKDCVARHHLQPYLRFGAELREAVFDEAHALWRLRMADGALLTARVLVSATGALSRPALPQLPGLENFRGAHFHSAEWDHGYDFAGKRVAVIGTGASAIQFVPQIAPQAAQLTLFQRTPPWILPKPDRAISAREQTLFRRLPGAARLFRSLVYWRQEITGLAFLHPKLMKWAERMALRHLRAQVPDPALRAKLTPHYTIGCKRILISNDYYPALARENVRLVTDGIAGVRAHGIVDRNGVEHAADAIVFGTGFRVADLLAPVRIVGRGGVELDHAWRETPQTYLGIMTAGFPNLFLLLGPNTGLGHNSVVFMAEQQIRYVAQCLRHMRKKRAATIEVRPEVQARFHAELQRRLQTTVWATGCKSWYLDEQGRNFTLWPGFTFQYWGRTRRAKAGEYRFA